MCGVVSMLLIFIQYKMDENDKITKANKATEQQNKRDSIADIRLEKNRDQIITTFAESLAKYGLKYDSTQKVITKLILDSTKRTTTIINRNEPAIDFCADNGVLLIDKKASNSSQIEN